MKFRWKIFFIFTSFITIIFSVFGTWMVNMAFQTSLQREIDRGKSENQFFQFAFELTLDSLGEEYMVMNETVFRDIADSMRDSGSDGESHIRVYGKNSALLFDNTGLKDHKDMISRLKSSSGGYRIYHQKDDKSSRYLLFVLCRAGEKDNPFYLENVIDISRIYNERAQLFSRYRIAILILLLCTGCVTLLLSRYLTRSVVSLSRTTRKFADGDYFIRAEKYGNDEIGELTKDFNSMADSLSRKITELSDAARKQEDFTASFAHELKTPLTSIIGYADMLRSMDLDRKEIMETSNYIYSQGKRLESLSLKLLDLIVSNKQIQDFCPVHMPAFMEEIRDIVTPSLREKNIRLVLNIDEGTITGDRDLLSSLFINLIDNARKALTEEGTVKIEGKCIRKGYQVCFRDDGCGIPKEELSRITEAFYMVDKSRSRKEGGAGLGLTLCSRIIRLHKAKWKIQSKAGKGTAVTVLFPKKEDKSEK